MTIKTKLLLSFFSIITIIMVSGILGITQLTRLSNQTQELSLIDAPLADAAMEIKNHTITAHLWLEEILTGTESKSRIDNVWQLLADSQWYLNAMLVGGKNAEGTFYPVTEDSLARKITLLQQDLRELELLAKQRFEQFSSTAKSDQHLDDEFDALFDKFLQAANEIENIIHLNILQDSQQAKQVADTAITVLIIATLLSFLLASLAIYYLSRDIIHQIGGEPAEIAKITEQVAAGRLDIQFQVQGNQQQATGIYASIQIMVEKLKQITADRFKQDWIKTGQTELAKVMRGEQTVMKLSQNVINFLAAYTKSAVGAVYLAQADHFKLVSSYAYKIRNNNDTEFKLGEGLVGQAALEKKTIVYSHLPHEQSNLTINAGLGEAWPSMILVLPLLLEEQVLGVIELGAANEFNSSDLELLDRVVNDIAITLHSAHARTRTQELLAESQRQQLTLQTQQEQLQASNEELQSQQEELQAQNEELQAQQEELQTQQEELRHANDELEERARELERQKMAIRDNNMSLENSQQILETKARELEMASRYKSEFLANMSHELRTPLNSMLILSQLLAENKPGNLDNKQVEYARTICSAGGDLLSLINEILDLAKVESGKVEIHQDSVELSELLQPLQQKFQPLAEAKGLTFQIAVATDVPQVWQSDAQRLKQILNNLLSNAFKFTSQGAVKLEIKTVAAEVGASNGLANNSLAISVTDTGIGIAPDKQNLIFEAFQQADGATNRRYGGTGLGLSISRHLARLLGGDIVLHSEVGKGSTFTFYLPLSARSTSVNTDAQVDFETSAWPTLSITSPAVEKTNQSVELAVPLVDDKDHLQPQDKTLLIVEDDSKFSKILMEIARDKHFKCLLAEDGQSGLQLATTYQPHAIILDVSLPQVDGWTVMERLKDNPQTRHIPVHFMSASDYSREARQKGAIGYLLKPISMEQLSTAFKTIERFIAKVVKHLLIVVEEVERQQEILELVSDAQIQATLVTTKLEALKQLHTLSVECIILDVDVEQGTGLQLLEAVQNNSTLAHIPVIIYAQRDLSPAEEVLIHRCENHLTVKSVKSPERLLEEVTLFLHQVEAQLSKEQRNMLQMVHNKEAILQGKKVLIVDDDIRNTFALVTTLEDKGMLVVAGRNGKEALELLAEQPDVEIVLMDIMMPEMDGYEAMQKIRAQSRFRKLPMIALTAKAMKGDKAKCIEAGANDYLSKPIDIDKLISLMRVWLYQ